MKKLLYSSFLVLSLMISTNVCFGQDSANLSAEDAMKKLKEGNERFVTLKEKHPMIILNADKKC